MRKIITGLLSLSCACAAPYVGVKAGFSKLKTNAKLSGTDAGPATPFSVNVSGMDYNSFNFGALVGYSFNVNSKLSVLLEGDYEYLTGSKSKANNDANQAVILNFLANEFVSVRAKHSLGFMPGIEVAVHEKVGLLVGVRLNWTQYEIKAYHVQGAGNVLPENNKTARSFVMGVEPTLGAKFKFNERLSARLTVGYNIGQSKKIISSYMNGAAALAANVTSAVTIKPRSVNVRAAVIYSF